MPHGVIVGEDTFAFLTELEIRKAVRLRYPVSILTIRAAFRDSPEPLPTARVDERLGRIISAKVRGTDVVEVPSVPSALLHVCLVGADLQDLPTVIERLMEELRGHKFEIHGRPEALRCSVGGSSFPATVDRSSALVAEADALALEARRAQMTYRLPERRR